MSGSRFVEHTLCEHCWWKKNPIRAPIRAVDPPPDRCCSCGCPTYTGIYVRGEDTEHPHCKHAPTRL